MAYRAMQGRARALALIGLLPVVVDRDSFETSAGNAWFTAETGLSDRAISYAIAELAKAGLITTWASGPRRRVRLVIPGDASQAVQHVQATKTTLPAHSMRASDNTLPAHAVQASKEALPAHGRQKARTRRAAIEGGRPPKAPRTELHRSILLAEQREQQAFVPGQTPAWLLDGTEVETDGTADQHRSENEPQLPERAGSRAGPANPIDLAIELLSSAGGSSERDEFAIDLASALIAAGVAEPADGEEEAEALIAKLQARARITITDDDLAGSTIRLRHPQSAGGFPRRPASAPAE